MKAAVTQILLFACLALLCSAGRADAAARFTFSPSRPVVSDKVRLTARASLCRKHPCRWLWERTGAHGKGAKPVKLGAARRIRITPRRAGKVWIRVTVRSKGGRRRTAVRSVTVRARLTSAGPAPASSLEVAPPGAGNAAAMPPTPSAVSAAAAIPPTPPLSPCSSHAAPGTFAAQFGAALPGETICLASGSYGTFKGAAKAGTVTVRGADGAAASMRLDFTSATNVVVQNVTVTGGHIGGSSRNVTVSRSSFTDLFMIDTQSANANVVLDGNAHVDLDAPVGGLPGRVTVWARGTPSGVTIKNSLFKGGDSDGVRPDSADVQVLGNEFADIVDKGANHADPIQFYGAVRAVVRGNYFHQTGGNVSAYIMQADGGVGNLIEDNVFGAGAHVGYAITLYSDKGSVIRHNTFQPGRCDFDISCGTLSLGSKSGDPAGSGTVIRDNILASIVGGQGTYSADHNLMTDRAAVAFAGPLNAYAGFRLLPGSAGTGAASDGLDVGIR